MFLYFHERTCTRAVIHAMSTAEIGDSDLSDRWPEWAKLGKGEGSSPLWATDLYEKRMFVAFVCVWLYRGCMTLHDFYGLWSDLEYHFDWKTEDDTHKHTAGSRLCGMCINKQGVGSHSTKTNPNCQTAQLLTMSLCCCLHAHFSQLSSDTARPSQALKTHSTPSSPLPLQCFI